MTAPLSQDLRERIVHAVEDGSTIRQAARRFAVSASAAIKLMQRVRQTGSTAPAKIGGYRRPLLEKHADDLRAIASSKAGITLREIKAALAARDIVVKALSTIADMLHRLGLSHKKEPESQRSFDKLRMRKTGPMSPATAAAGASGSATWMQTASSSLTRRARPRP
jgi:transposase